MSSPSRKCTDHVRLRRCRRNLAGCASPRAYASAFHPVRRTARSLLGRRRGSPERWSTRCSSSRPLGAPSAPFGAASPRALPAAVAAEFVDTGAKAEHGTCAPLRACRGRNTSRVEFVGDGLQPCHAVSSNLYNDRGKLYCSRVGFRYEDLRPVAPLRPRLIAGHWLLHLRPGRRSVPCPLDAERPCAGIDGAMITLSPQFTGPGEAAQGW
jgi:hypothetical protein